MVNLLNQELTKAFGSKFNFESKSIPGGTGCLEVMVILEDGSSKLVHSKLGGQGKINSSNVGRIVDEIKKIVT